MNKNRWLRRALTFLLIATMVLQPLPMTSMPLNSMTAAAEEANGETESVSEDAKKAAEEEKKKEEEERKKKEEEERKKKEAEEKAAAEKKAAEEKAAAEKKAAEEKAAAEKKAEEEKKAAEEKKAEEEKKAAEEKKAEEEKKSSEEEKKSSEEEKKAEEDKKSEDTSSKEDSSSENSSKEESSKEESSDKDDSSKEDASKEDSSSEEDSSKNEDAAKEDSSEDKKEDQKEEADQPAADDSSDSKDDSARQDQTAEDTTDKKDESAADGQEKTGEQSETGSSDTAKTPENKTDAENGEKAAEEKTYELVFKAKDGGKVALSSDADDTKDKIRETLKEGEHVKVKAVPDKGYKFKKWTKDGDDYSTKEEIRVKASNEEYIAWFEEEVEDTKEAQGTGSAPLLRAPARTAEDGNEDGTDPLKEGEETTNPEEQAKDTWTVTFVAADGSSYVVRKVKKGEAVGDLPDGDGLADEGFRFSHWEVGGSEISSSYVPKSDVTAEPKFDKTEYTVSFYESEDATEAYATKKVDVDTSFYLNDIPSVPQKSGYAGKWVYSGGDFNNNVQISGDTKVWASYDQNVFIVKWMVEGKEYLTESYDAGAELALPSDPAAEGKTFVGWFVGDKQYQGGEKVTSDLTITAKFKDAYRVRFIISESGEEILTQYFEAGEKIGTLPQAPFATGKVFEKWVLKDDTETEVTADTVVNSNFDAIAVFKDLNVYTITANFYYLNDGGHKVIVNDKINFT